MVVAVILIMLMVVVNAESSTMKVTSGQNASHRIVKVTAGKTQIIKSKVKVRFSGHVSRG